MNQQGRITNAASTSPPGPHRGQEDARPARFLSLNCWYRIAFICCPSCLSRNQTEDSNSSCDWWLQIIQLPGEIDAHVTYNSHIYHIVLKKNAKRTPTLGQKSSEKMVMKPHGRKDLSSPKKFQVS